MWLMVTKVLPHSLPFKPLLVRYIFQMRKTDRQVNQNYVKHREGNQSLTPVNKCFPDLFSHSLVPIFLICQLFLSAKLFIIEISQVLFYSFFCLYLPNISWVHSLAQLPQPSSLPNLHLQLGSLWPRTKLLLATEEQNLPNMPNGHLRLNMTPAKFIISLAMYFLLLCPYSQLREYSPLNHLK